MEERQSRRGGFCEKGIYAGVGVHMYIYTKCMCIFIYTAEKVHMHTKV